MGRLPVLSGADAVRIFGKADWTVDRQRGSHIILVKDGHIATLSVPDHRELARGTLRSLFRAAGMTTEDFEALAKDQTLVFRAIVYRHNRSRGAWWRKRSRMADSLQESETAAPPACAGDAAVAGCNKVPP